MSLNQCYPIKCAGFEQDSLHNKQIQLFINVKAFFKYKEIY